MSKYTTGRKHLEDLERRVSALEKQSQMSVEEISRKVSDLLEKLRRENA